ncbi:unnamed protein product [Prunus armeniaca]
MTENEAGEKLSKTDDFSRLFRWIPAVADVGDGWERLLGWRWFEPGRSGGRWCFVAAAVAKNSCR